MRNDISDARAGAETSAIPVELEAFFKIAERWNLSTDDQILLLGSPGRSTFFKWKKETASIPADTRERISHLLGIWKSLHIVFTDDDQADEWVRRSNRYFDGASALDVMLEGNVSSIYRVRRYLDAQRGG
ncbi:uncharacterized protein (DUF2384 family) [Agrobacterium tumefaciens]|uniref:MbcA/ParS/Xre antitoxin family protein n=1 Tax=Agrobacterium tumefaciens TaxID=358 RepID=UPI000DD0C095|nr:MbcA/ParS/Xre antitoxin family protein [Agrobacterium tumefaciens]MBP2510292.1 uncharacterized protein (DUF2384 family) [Agrobacterium tumefaciens]MBP2519129.1 uncharacterized protein (DUF2384 family) [Agrobacterium tumefaciens]MBP2577145.1 uncharacterized protein (DUF2384 family) [Agrobacterium tumefaciens]MBP2596486.1 uncharacterized protein (DUF2384 family) [Agrobacterium tumefaciens]MDP9857703.1 uncharacterized protein (DUF2384 family) [Agrobacterium tumefaciens]